MFDPKSFTYAFYQTCVRGVQQMSPEARKQLSKTTAAMQGPGGFFYGRAGQEDLYYTFFGLLLAAVTGAKIRKKECAAKLRPVDFVSLDLVHACAWLRAKKLLRWLAVPHFLRMMIPVSQGNMFDLLLMKKLQSLPNLPHHTFPQQDADSPYSRFLLGTLYTDFAQAMPEFDLSAYRLPNGLYTNLKYCGSQCSPPYNEELRVALLPYGVNATAAALFLLPFVPPAQQPGQCQETADALCALQEPDGSFKAAASAPEGDLMSTATAAFALQRCGKVLPVSPKPFLQECFRDNGLFAATPHDPDGDLEYTAYGLLLMG